MQDGAQLPLPQPEQAAEVVADRHGDNGAMPGPSAHKESLLAAAAKARKVKPAETEAERLLREEQEIMKTITTRMALKSVKENAQVCTASFPRFTEELTVHALMTQAKGVG